MLAAKFLDKAGVKVGGSSADVMVEMDYFKMKGAEPGLLN